MSAIRSVLVHLDTGEDGPGRIRAGAEIARRCGAELTALYAVAPAIYGAPLDWSGASAGWLAEFDEENRNLARSVFDKAKAEFDVPMHWRECREGMPVAETVRAAYVHDLVVLGQRRPALRWPSELPADFVQAVVIDSGMPALVVPQAMPYVGMGHRAMVAWKPTREAARALHAALPLLQTAQTVTVVGWGEDAAASAEGVRQWLARHDVQSRLDVSAGAQPDAVGELLLSSAADLEADLLVCGCYGHSRTREWVLGGATRTLLQSMTLPTLMAH